MQARTVVPRAVLLAAVGAFAAGNAGAQEADDVGAPSLRAVRVESGTVQIDGRLDEAAWTRCDAADRFTQVLPDDGTAPTERTDVRMLYDGSALYVGARLYDTEPDLLAGRLGRRDGDSSSDQFILSVDSYHDHRTAFRFATNPAGVRGDWIATNDDDSEDRSWNPVWEVATSIDSLGWIAEMRIPFSQLRFSGQDDPLWGVNFTRLIYRKSEWVVWSWWDDELQGFASHFGHLEGLRGLRPPRRLEVLPYTVAKIDHDEAADPSSPFHDGSRQSVSAGMDINFGLTSDLTLNAAINPDFGQVEADPAVVNLTAYETFFEEQRPFFVEGANLFRFGAGSGGFIHGAPQLFYSRRVGKAPFREAFDPSGFVDNPLNTAIIAAGKVSGQTGGWSVGVLDAVTGNEYAEIERSDGTRLREPVEPRTNYGVVSLRRDFRDGGTGLGLLATSVIRDLHSPLFAGLADAAYAGGMDFFHRFADNRYVVTATLSGSYVRGDQAAMLRAQGSSARFYQRPDQDHVSIDSAAASLSGYATSVQFSKVSGNWLVGTDFYAYSPGFEINDAGFQSSVDDIFHGIRLTRRWLDPGRVFRRFFINATWAQTWNFGGIRTGRSAYLGLSAFFHNYWMARVQANWGPGSMSDRTTRGGPLMKAPGQYSAGITIESDTRRIFSGSAAAFYGRGEYGGWGVETGSGWTYRPTGSLSLRFSPGFDRSRGMAQYVTQLPDPTATATFGRRFLFAEIRRTTLNATFRFELALTPDLSVQLWAQPFMAVGDYSGFKELEAPRTFSFLEYGRTAASSLAYDQNTDTYTVDPDGPGDAAPITFGNPDFRVRSVRSNLVIRWEYRPGSTLFVVWNHSRSGFDREPTFRLFDQAGELLEDDMQNTFLVKLNYWLSR